MVTPRIVGPDDQSDEPISTELAGAIHRSLDQEAVNPFGLPGSPGLLLELSRWRAEPTWTIDLRETARRATIGGSLVSARLLAYAVFAGYIAIVTFLIGWNVTRLQDYQSAEARASLTLTGEVVTLEEVHKAPDRILVRWVLPTGQAWQRWFEPTESGEYTVGDAFQIKVDPARPERALPADPDAIDAVDDDATVGLFLLFLAVPAPLVMIFLRLRRWTKAARGTPRPATVQFVDDDATGVAKALVCDHTGRIWAQRVMWEPWMATHDWVMRVVARRAGGHLTGFVLDVPELGRVWPASRARPDTPVFTAPVRHGSRLVAICYITLVSLVCALFYSFACYAALVVHLLLGWQLFGGAPLRWGRR